MKLPPRTIQKPAFEPYVPAERICKGLWWLVGKTVWLVCTKCKNQQAAIATGYTAENMTNEVAIKCGIAMGWQMAPKVLCLFCATPLSSSEMVEYAEMLVKVDEGGGDFGDIEEIKAFEEHMKHKYGPQAMVHMNKILKEQQTKANLFKSNL